MSTPSNARIYLTANGTTLGFKLIDLDVLSGGNVEWAQKARSRSKYMNAPGGQLPLLYTLPLRLDGFASTPDKDRSQRSAMNTLWAWSQFKTQSGKTQDPPKITLSGGVRAPSGRQWIITQITENAYQLNEAGVLVQYDVTLELTEYVGPQVTSPAATAKKKAIANDSAAYSFLSKQYGNG